MPGFTEHEFRGSRPRSGPWTAAGRRLLAALALGAGLTMLALAAPARRNEPTAAPRLVLDLNAAPVEVLSALPGVGPSLAREIDARRAEAPFLSLSDFGRRARGVGPATLARLARHLRTGADEVAARLHDGPPRPR
ncbi:ComEA family DNA-binding protein [Paludisphaera soli]|uniref:ComEA family DNA-binding protein n=1 Tax=Paludisphaera soli TaxID=2712865 RepID=UPI0013EDE9AE|nr:helix-hairpin-helix domain-containing protein [Paludisphaera soli]